MIRKIKKAAKIKSIIEHFQILERNPLSKTAPTASCKSN